MKHRQISFLVHPSSASLENIWIPSESKLTSFQKDIFQAEKKYIPYIFSVEELTRFFAETDKCQYCYECPYRHLIMPIIFRMIYTCGLRLSEARLLKVADVDLENGVLTIHQSKKDKSRLVPMSKSLTERCRTFSKKVILNR